MLQNGGKRRFFRDSATAGRSGVMDDLTYVALGPPDKLMGP